MKTLELGGILRIFEALAINCTLEKFDFTGFTKRVLSTNYPGIIAMLSKNVSLLELYSGCVRSSFSHFFLHSNRQSRAAYFYGSY